MIEEVRKGYRENPAEFDRHLGDREDAYLYKRFADEIHQTLIKTRRNLQEFFDLIDALQSGNVRLDYRIMGMRKREEHNLQLDNLVSFFIGVQKASSNVVKGEFHLSRKGVLPRPQADDLLHTADTVMEEGKQLVVFCQNNNIPCFDSDFIRKVLTSPGYEGFKKIVEDEQFAVLRNKPDLFREAILHQQGPDAFLQSKAKSARHIIDELRSKGEFDDLLKDDPEILGHAVLYYPTARTTRNKKFSNAHDYLLFLREQKKIAAAKKKNGRKKPVRAEW